MSNSRFEISERIIFVFLFYAQRVIGRGFLHPFVDYRVEAASRLMLEHFTQICSRRREKKCFKMGGQCGFAEMDSIGGIFRSRLIASGIGPAGRMPDDAPQ
jgi:hypothetical protein